MEKENKNQLPQHQKEVIQSYILTAAKYDYTVYEKRIMYKLVELAQDQLQGQRLRGKINHNLWGFVEVEFPISDLLVDDNDNNYTRLKNALLSMTKKTIVYEDRRVWQAFNLIIRPKIEKYNGLLAFTLDPQIWSCILDFTKGYRKIELQTAMQFKSTYAMRFYELLIGQKTPLTYTIDHLKEMFQIKGYDRPNMFIKKVVDAAKKELDKCSPITFTYEVNRVGRKVISISFFPVQQPQFKSEQIEQHELNRRVSLSWDIARPILNFLKNNIGFTTAEIKNNRDLFIAAQQQIPDLLLLLSDLNARTRATDIANPKGYIINALRNQLNEQQQGKN